MHITGKKNFQILGKLLVINRPEIAQELYNSYLQPVVKPVADNHELISSYYSAFCEHMQIQIDHCQGALFKRSRVEIRRTFISCLMRIYNPAAYLQPEDSIINRPGFVKEIAAVLQTGEQRISETIRQAIAQERIYEDYRIRVNDIYQKLIGKDEHGTE